jgi:hypothetical protein
MRWRFELEQCSICDLSGQTLLLEIWLYSHKPKKTPIYHLLPGLVFRPLCNVKESIRVLRRAMYNVLVKACMRRSLRARNECNTAKAAKYVRERGKSNVPSKSFPVQDLDAHNMISPFQCKTSTRKLKKDIVSL